MVGLRKTKVCETPVTYSFLALLKAPLPAPLSHYPCFPFPPLVLGAYMNSHCTWSLWQRKKGFGVPWINELAVTCTHMAVLLHMLCVASMHDSTVLSESSIYSRRAAVYTTSIIEARVNLLGQIELDQSSRVKQPWFHLPYVNKFY